jgi:hypothetical protein
MAKEDPTQEKPAAGADAMDIDPKPADEKKDKKDKKDGKKQEDEMVRFRGSFVAS